MSDDRLFGDVEFTGKDIATRAVKFDKLAISGRDELLMISLMADTQIIKQIRAILSGGAKATAQAGGIKVKRPSAPDWDTHSPGRLNPSDDGYHCHVHKLGYGMAHALFLSRTAGFMKVVTPESLWQELTSTRYTTPLLREWVPFIEGRLRADDTLQEALVFNCRCGLLTCTTAGLDEVVSEGLNQGRIEIPRPVAIAF
jgi:hypothetical protein